MKLQHDSQRAYHLTCCKILLIHYTVDWSSFGSLLTFDRSPYMHEPGGRMGLGPLTFLPKYRKFK